MKSTTAAIQAAESAARRGFRSYDAMTGSFRAQIEPVDPARHKTVSQLIVASSKYDPIKIKTKHAEIDAAFLKSIDDAVEILENHEAVGKELQAVARYLLGEIESCPERFLEHAMLVKAASSTGVVSAAQTAAEILRATQGGLDEVARVKKVWVEKTRDAATVALRSKQFLLSRSSAFDDQEIQKTRLAEAQKTYESKHGQLRRTRLEATK